MMYTSSLYIHTVIIYGEDIFSTRVFLQPAKEMISVIQYSVDEISNRFCVCVPFSIRPQARWNAEVDVIAGQVAVVIVVG